jgi:hypothetical protein
MPQVSFRTLTLMLLLLASVLTHHYVNWASTAHADVIWLGGNDDPNDPNEPLPEVSNAVPGSILLDDDPNEPLPEVAAWDGGQIASDDDPNEPLPEIATWILGQVSSDDDPNEPSEPLPEVA